MSTAVMIVTGVYRHMNWRWTVQLLRIEIILAKTRYALSFCSMAWRLGASFGFILWSASNRLLGIWEGNYATHL
jgi:hypothetical protein